MTQFWNAFAVCSALCLFCCHLETGRAPPAATTQVTDMLGRQVTVKTSIQRVVLLRTMDIDLLAALLGRDLDRKLVAVGNDFAQSDQDGYRKFSEVFHVERFKALGSVYADDGINAETVVGLRPDLVIVDSYFRERACVKKLIALGMPVFFTDHNTDPFLGVVRALRRLGPILGVAPHAEQMAAYAEARIRSVLARVDTIRAAGIPRPVLYWEQGSTIPQEIGITDGDTSYSWGLVWHRLGADNMGVGSNFQAMNPERVLTRDPDLIVIGGANWNPHTNIMRLGFYISPNQAIEHLTEYTQRPGWARLKAVRTRRLYALHYNYYGRTYSFACFQTMAKMLYPADFADLDPERELIEFFQRFMPFAYSGLHSVQWHVAG